MSSNERPSNIASRGQLLGRAGAIALLLGVSALFIFFEALIIGYVVFTLLLCAFFVVVAFDIGVDRTVVERVEETRAAEHQLVEGRPKQPRPRRSRLV